MRKKVKQMTLLKGKIKRVPMKQNRPLKKTYYSRKASKAKINIEKKLQLKSTSITTQILSLLQVLRHILFINKANLLGWQKVSFATPAATPAGRNEYL